MRSLIAAVFYGLAVLNLMWFAGALRNTLTDAGQDGWGAAATASSAAIGALFLLTDSSSLATGRCSLRGPTPFPCFARVHVRTPFLGQAPEVRLEGRALAAGV